MPTPEMNGHVGAAREQIDEAEQHARRAIQELVDAYNNCAQSPMTWDEHTQLRKHAVDTLDRIGRLAQTGIGQLDGIPPSHRASR